MTIPVDDPSPEEIRERAAEILAAAPRLRVGEVPPHLVDEMTVPLAHELDRMCSRQRIKRNQMDEEDGDK